MRGLRRFFSITLGALRLRLDVLTALLDGLGLALILRAAGLPFEDRFAGLPVTLRFDATFLAAAGFLLFLLVFLGAATGLFRVGFAARAAFRVGFAARAAFRGLAADFFFPADRAVFGRPARIAASRIMAAKRPHTPTGSDGILEGCSLLHLKGRCKRQAKSIIFPLPGAGDMSSSLQC
jgi:hypothetical protein